MRYLIGIVVFSGVCLGVTWQDVCNDWLEADSFADLNNDGIVNFKDYAMYCKIQWQDQPIESFRRSSIAFDEGQEIAINVRRQRKVLLVSNSDGAILTDGGFEGRRVSPYCVTGDTIYGLDEVGRLNKSTDGISWTRTDYEETLVRLFRTPQGNLLTFIKGSTREMRRSTDGGNTFTNVTPTGEDAMDGTGYPADWSIHSHHGVMMYVEYGPGAEQTLGGRYIFRSLDDGVTWEKVLDANDLTTEIANKIKHWHVVSYHAASGRWIATSGDASAKRENLYSEDDGLTWHRLTGQLESVHMQPISLLDYGHEDYLLAGDDSAAQLFLWNIRTGKTTQIYRGLNPESRSAYVFDLAYHEGLYYAISGSTQATHFDGVIVISADLVNWSVYHRFDPDEEMLWGFYSGFINGKLHWRIQCTMAGGGGEDYHFAISPAKVSLVDGILVSPSVTNMMSADNSSMEAGIGNWYSGGGIMCSHSDDVSLHGSHSLKLEIGANVSQQVRMYELGNLEVGKTYVAMMMVRGGPVSVQFRSLYHYESGGDNNKYLGPHHYFSTDDDDKWHLVYSTPCTIDEDINPDNLRLLPLFGAGPAGATVYIDCAQIVEVPMKPWMLGGAVQADEKLTATVSVPMAWTDIFALQTLWPVPQYGVQEVLNVKTWLLDTDNYISLKFDTGDRRFYLERVAAGVPQTPVSSDVQYWPGNAILKFALRVSQTEVKLTIQNGRSIEILEDDGHVALISDDITLIYGDADSKNQFPAIVCNGWEWDVIVPYWVADNNIAATMNLTAPAFEIKTAE